MDEITKIWPEWKTVGTLGKGTFGNVYKVQKDDLGMESYAALKVIHIPQDEDEVMELQNAGWDDQSIHTYYKDVLDGLKNEIQIMVQLKTAGNIVSIEDYKMVEDEAGLGGTLYIRMELLESLGNYVRKNDGLDIEEAVKLGIDICSALECCEQSHTIHRDIKPGNIFRNPYGAYKLGDFGISKQMEGTQSLLRSTVGTRMYMAPEIHRGESYDNTVDIYALGITMYWLLNNRRFPFMPKDSQPIGRNDMEKAAGDLISGKEMEAPANGDEMLAYIVKRACAYRAEERYQSAAEMKVDLLKWQLEKKFIRKAADPSSLETPQTPETPSKPETPPNPETPSNSEIPPNRRVPPQETIDRTDSFREEPTYSAFSSIPSGNSRNPASESSDNPPESQYEQTYRAFSSIPSGEKGENGERKHEQGEIDNSQALESDSLSGSGLKSDVKVSDAGESDANGSNARVYDVSEFKKGNIVTFGAYYQDAEGNEKTPIEWEVVDKEEDICLLLSRYVLDYKRYHDDADEKVSWSGSSLRKWLNEDFRNSSFTQAERDALHESVLGNADYVNKTKTETYIPETWDKVFCLSFEEAEKQYSFTESEYQTYPTDYALQKMSIFTEKNAPVSWWLRSANRMQGKALVALPQGYIGFFPPLVSDYNGVRPAIRVNLSKLQQR